MEADDYNLEADEDMAEPSASTPTPDVEEAGADDKPVEEKLEPKNEEEIDDSLADWFKIEREDDQKSKAPSGSKTNAANDNSDTETDDDSDNADVVTLDQEVDDFDDWFKVKKDVESASAPGSQEQDVNKVRFFCF